mmetsp:Transcript_29694/g.49008  ORF Transcript_29694/g.49008 Transcript_29694/m.49008 type:complete len:410 (-) Transcript_29694:249-1478(-)|eukprot:CAMPEP_0119031270 /NCGR_PEP_ID=MMETSP1176-20130426/41456_1 /TAXON_ID=265551 /ORGANISM="Synedropsis recta cf, Strain CCMP1620" /LENGTH=409 /DNA_ID=CAMNT_0006987661 /DNA_START=122 /DNA_END=1351 /DNA_ORIENTATION=+
MINNADGPVQTMPSRRLLSRSMSDDSDASNDVNDHTSSPSEDSDNGEPSRSNASSITSYWARREERQAMRSSIIAKMDVGLDDLEDQLQNLNIELDFRKSATALARAEHKTKIEEKTNCNDNLKFRLNKALTQEIERRSSLGGYVSTMRGFTGPGSMYVQTIEGQACRSLHLLGVRKKQRDLMNHQANQMAHYMKRVIQEQEDITAEVSQRVMTQLFEVGCETRDYAKKCDTILKKQRLLIDKLEAVSWQASFLGTDWACAEELSSKGAEETKSRRPRRRASISFSPTVAEQSKRELRPRTMSTDSVDEAGVNEMIEEVKEQPKNRNRPVRRSSLGGMVSSFNTFTKRLSAGCETPSPSAEHHTAENNMHTSTAVSVETADRDDSEPSLPKDTWNPAISAAAAAQQIAT